MFKGRKNFMSILRFDPRAIVAIFPSKSTDEVSQWLSEIGINDYTRESGGYYTFPLYSLVEVLYRNCAIRPPAEEIKR